MDILQIKINMQQKKLGNGNITASQIGLGCMGMSEFYGEKNDEESLRTLDRAFELGITFWDTADAYGPFTNEILVGKSLKNKRDKITLATKFGIVRDQNDPTKRSFSGKPEYVKAACEASLQRLKTDVIDLYYLHRVDAATPVEETVGAMADLVQEGKIRGIGLSEVSAETLINIHKNVHPVTALQTEYSLWSREPEDGILETCKQNNIAFVAYSPLGRGFLTGQLKKFEDFESNDYRRFSPRFQGENFNKNLQLVTKLTEMAAQKNCTPAQLALAWVLHQGEHIFPIPGTKRIKYLEENANAVNINLTSADLKKIADIFPRESVAGDRYPSNMMGNINK